MKQGEDCTVQVSREAAVSLCGGREFKCVVANASEGSNRFGELMRLERLYHAGAGVRSWLYGLGPL